MNEQQIIDEGPKGWTHFIDGEYYRYSTQKGEHNHNWYTYDEETKSWHETYFTSLDVSDIRAYADILRIIVLEIKVGIIK